MKRLPQIVTVLFLGGVLWLAVGPERGSSPEYRKTPSLSGEVPQSAPGTPSRSRFLNRAQLQKAVPATPVPVPFVRGLSQGRSEVSFQLPDGRKASGIIEMRFTDKEGNPTGVDGRLVSPGEGRFRFRLQPEGDLAGPVTGSVVMGDDPIAFRVERGADGGGWLTAFPKEDVVCQYAAPLPPTMEEPQYIPADHPVEHPVPVYQNGIVPLQSLPGAVGVIYLDFDGQEGPHEGWGDFDAEAPNLTNSQVREIWERVAEDFAPFNLNVTTDLQVYLAAPENSRQRCVVTPTDTPAPGMGGVAGSQFNSVGDVACWSFATSGKAAAEVISHEVGHTLGLYHDGRYPGETYYAGHGVDPVGWAPIMGSGLNKNLSQWSKGEYAQATEVQDDLNVIDTTNNNVDFRTDDAGATHATATPLEIFGNGDVDDEGTISRATDVDAFRFTTTGGALVLSVQPVANGPNLDVSASVYAAAGTLVTSSNPDLALDATLSANLPAGEYTVRVDGVGRGSATGSGYSDYGSVGQYTIRGTIGGTKGPSRFTIVENPAAGAVVGTPELRNDHGTSALAWSISAGNTGGLFQIHPGTGEITVAPSATFDFEALGGSWLTPPTYQLTVLVQDTGNPSLNETLTVVIAISDANEAPAITGTPLVVLARTVPGTVLGAVTASDPDQYDVPVFSIVGGDPDGQFGIDGSGRIVAAGSWEVMQPAYALVVRVTDQGGLSAETTVNVSVIPVAVDYMPGGVYRTIYDGITPSGVAALTSSATYPRAPTREVRLDEFGDRNRGASFGSTIRCWMIAPVTGNYTFWIAADNAADLYFSAGGNPSSAAKIAYNTTNSGYRNWTSSPNQKSAVVPLAAGQLCYMEARHKQDTSQESVSVAWEIKEPSGSATLVAREVIPGRYLAPHHLNYTPKVAPVAVTLLRNAYQGATVARVNAVDLNAGDTHTWTITSGNSSGIFGIDGATGRVFVANPAALAASGATSFPLTLSATDDGLPALSGSGVVTVNISNANNLSIPSGDTVVWTSGNYQYASALIEGTLHLRGDASIGISGSMVNRGVLDLIHWNGTLPSGVINEGVILDRSSVKILSSTKTEDSFQLTTPGYAGHAYQLKTADDLAGPWMDSGEPVTGTGTPSAPQVILLSAPVSGERGFYRVVVTPAP